MVAQASDPLALQNPIGSFMEGPKGLWRSLVPKGDWGEQCQDQRQG